MVAQAILVAAKRILAAAIFAGGFQNRHFGRGIRDGFGGVSPYYGYDYSSCYVVTPDGYAWVCD